MHKENNVLSQTNINNTEYEGPFVYENWKAATIGNPIQHSFEYPLFTDAHILGALTKGYGPYQILNILPGKRTITHTPSLVLRLNYHLPFNLHPLKIEQTDVTRYHGGSLEDEIAALISLCLGIRLKAGGCIREFPFEGDPKGYPVAYEAYKNPVLIKPTTNMHPVLPYAVGVHSLKDTVIFSKFLDISAHDANIIIRAARLYQDAVWVAESEPSLSWVMLVSAIESAANHWRTSRESSEERLKASKPELEKILREKGGQDFVLKIADMIEPYMGATKKFIDFVDTFLPEPPEIRPSKYAQLIWSRKAFKKSMQKIYDWRSKALHGGTPFPEPMCSPPCIAGEAYSEKPITSGGIAQGGIWIKDDTPILLHAFEFIVRKALLKWWAAILQNNKKNPNKALQLSGGSLAKSKGK